MDSSARPNSAEKKKKKERKKKEVPTVGEPTGQARIVSPPHNLDSHMVMDIRGQSVDVDVVDLRQLEALGQGINGPVYKMEHVPSGNIMAVKKIQHVSYDPVDEKRLIMDLETNMKAKTLPHAVRFFGAMYSEGEVWLCMEVMDTCLDKFYKKVYALGQTIPEEVIGKIAVCVIQALHHLKVALKIAHRDVKPSNVLLNREGEIKICDYGISGRLENSLNYSYVGTQMYMAPEYIDPSKDKGEGFSVRADVWSLGLTLMEIALGRFPYDKCDSAFQQIQVVVKGDPPRLPEGDRYSAEFCDFIATCLTKEEDKRPKFEGLMEHPFFIRSQENTDVELSRFFSEILDAAR